MIDPAPLWQALLADWRAGTAVPIAGCPLP